MLTPTGKEQPFNEGIRNNNSQTDNTPDLIVTQSLNGVHGIIDPANLPISDATQEAIDEIPIASPESDRLPLSQTTIVAWGDSLTAGSGGGGNTYPIALNSLTNFTILNKGVGGISSTVIKNSMVADTVNYDKSVIIWAGRNNFTSPETVKADIATMVAALTHDRYLVMGMINGNYPIEYKDATNYNIMVQLNADLKATYGDKYVPIREFLVSLHDDTTQGLLDFSRDIVPYNIRFDEIHLNSFGYTKVAEFLNERLSIMLNRKDEYLQSKDFDYYSKTYTSKNGISNQKAVVQTADFRINGDGYAENFRPQNSLVLEKTSLPRWNFRLQSPEVGSVSGSNLVLTSYFDSGTLAKSDLITIFRFNDHFIYKSGVSNPVDRGVLFDIAGSFGANTISMFNPLTETADYPLLTWNSDTKGVRVYPVNTFAKTASPALTGAPTAPTATAGTNTTQLATTAFVQDAVSGLSTDIQDIVDATVTTGVLDGGNSSIDVLSGFPNSRLFEAKVGAFGNISNISLSNDIAYLGNEGSSGSKGGFLVSSGVPYIEIINPGIGETNITFDEPVAETTISFPALPAGAYTVAMQQKQYTVATLPIPTGSDSRFAIVTDATTPTYLGALTGGGSVVCPAFYNGSAWVSH